MLGAVLLGACSSFVQYTDEQLDADWEITIYPGADARFTVYEDSGDGYGYETGEFATWTLTWNETTGRLTIGERKGSFPGMVGSRVLMISVIGKESATKSVVFTGARQDA